MVEIVQCPYNTNHEIELTSDMMKTEVSCPICNKAVGVVIGKLKGVDDFPAAYQRKTVVRLDVGESRDFSAEMYSEGRLAWGTWNRGDTISLVYRKGKAYPKIICNHDEAVCYDLQEKTNSCGPGCFIATAAYGTPLSPEIIILKKFRDKKLKPNPVGSCFVELYYRMSPPIAGFIEKRETCKSVTRFLLQPVIRVCNYIMKG
ncbi:MAG: hypothetical protein JW737_03245 [Acidobacteria bacterium]|nr:hypothetical protein [Acidobacteriota bacterium]